MIWRLQHLFGLSGVRRCFSTDGEVAALRAWLAGLSVARLPSKAISAQMSRASGPGGQHVNKTNSRAELHLKLEPWPTELPAAIRPHLLQLPSYQPSAQSLRVTASQARSQKQNIEACRAQLVALLAKAGQQALPAAEPSTAQRAKVKALVQKEKKAKREMKDYLKSKKSQRRTNVSFD